MQLAKLDEYLFSDPGPILSISTALVNYRHDNDDHPILKFAGQFQNYNSLIDLRKKLLKILKPKEGCSQAKKLENVVGLVSSVISALQLAHVLKLTKEIVKDNLAAKIEKVAVCLKTWTIAQKRKKIFLKGCDSVVQTNLNWKLGSAIFELLRAFTDPFISSRRMKLGLDATGIGLDYCVYSSRQEYKEHKKNVRG